MAAARLSHKPVFLGEGIMIEVIFARGKNPVRSSTCRRRDPAAILADSVALPQTRAVAEPIKVGVEVSAKASHVMTDIRSASHSQGIRGPYATMAVALAAYEQHLGLTTSRRQS